CHFFGAQVWHSWQRCQVANFLAGTNWRSCFEAHLGEIAHRPPQVDWATSPLAPPVVLRLNRTKALPNAIAHGYSLRSAKHPDDRGNGESTGRSVGYRAHPSLPRAFPEQKKCEQRPATKDGVAPSRVRFPTGADDGGSGSP